MLARKQPTLVAADSKSTNMDALRAFLRDNARVSDSIIEQAGVYQQQLKAYLRTYTSGELYSRITHTKADGSVELMREIVAKGQNKNPNRLLDLKGQALNPPKAMKAADFLPASASRTAGSATD